MEPAGFTLMRMQIEGMPHYDEQQVIFILDDPIGFSARIPVILGTPTINRVIQTMKESEIHKAPSEWQAVRVAFEWTQGFQLRRTSRCRGPLGSGQEGLAHQQVYDTGFPIHCCPWSYPEHDDDGALAEHYDTVALS